MLLVFANEGLSYLAGFWPLGDDQFAHLHLYVNNVTPARASVNSDFERPFEDTGDGRVLIDPDLSFDGGPPPGLVISWPSADLVCEGDHPGRKCFGYVVVKEAGPMIYARRFDTPVNWDVDGLVMHLAPSMRMSSLQPV